MKKSLLTFSILSLTTIASYAQVWGGNGNTNNNTTDELYRIGNVGIGTSNTTEKLVLRGNMRLMGLSDYSIYANATVGRFGIYGNTNSATGPFLEFFGANNVDHPGAAILGSYGPTGEIKFCNYNNNAWNIQAKLTALGSLIIGNVVPPPNNPYGLYVEKGILTSQIKVALPNTNDWSDYVFAPDYKLMPLSQLQQYIDDNNHLPDVPSAEEVVNTGINLGQMDATLLKKIEELTLYTLDLQKQVTQLQEKIVNLESHK